MEDNIGGMDINTDENMSGSNHLNEPVAEESAMEALKAELDEANDKYLRKVAEFDARGVQLIGVSVDSHFSHLAWRNTPRDKGGIGAIKFPLVADLTKSISRDYDVLTGDGAVAFRGLFLIDKDGKVRHQVVNDLPLGRSVDEALRMVDALQFHTQHGEVCPANWNKGKEGMKPNAEGVAKYLAANASKL